MYYPILKLRSSEILAINEIKKDIIPIIEVDNNAEEKTLDYLKDCKKSYYLDFKTKNNLLDLAKTKTFFPVLGVDRDYYYNFSCIELARKTGKALIRFSYSIFKTSFAKIFANFTGTALPICLYILFKLPVKIKSSGKV